MSLDFEETESEKILRQTVRDFARKEIAPHARKWDEEESFPSALIPKLAVDEIDAEEGAMIAAHKHQAQDEELFFVSGRTETTVGKQAYQTGLGCGSCHGMEAQGGRAPALAGGVELEGFRSAHDAALFPAGVVTDPMFQVVDDWLKTLADHPAATEG